MSNKEKNYAYIKVYKDYAKSFESKFDEGAMFNVMHLPKGVKVGEVDLSGGIINPKLMYEDRYNSNMVVAQYDKNYLEDNAITVNIRRENNDYEKIRVDIDVLASCVNEVNKEYLKNRKKEQKVENNFSEDKTHEEKVEKEITKSKENEHSENKEFSIEKENTHEYTY